MFVLNHGCGWLWCADEDMETNARIALSGIMNTINKMPRIPLNIICVIDRSDSMTGEKIQRAKQALTLILETIQAGDRCTVITFASGTLAELLASLCC